MSTRRLDPALGVSPTITAMVKLGAFVVDRRPLAVLMATAAMAWGACVVLLGLAIDLRVALVALFAGGAVNFVLSTFRNAISQAYTDDALRGRIQGSLTVVLIGGGALTIVAVALVIRAVPQLWRYDARIVPSP